MEFLGGILGGVPRPTQGITSSIPRKTFSPVNSKLQNHLQHVPAQGKPSLGADLFSIPCEEEDEGGGRARGCAHTCEGGAGGGAGVAGHQDLVVVLPGQGAVDHPVAVSLSLAVVPSQLQAGGAPRAHPQVLGGIDLCVTQGREAWSHRWERTL